MKEAMLSVTPRWYRLGSGAGVGQAVREKGRGLLVVTLATAFALVLMATSWPVLTSVFDPESSARSDGLPVWLLMDTQTAYGQYRAGLEACLTAGECNAAVLRSRNELLSGGLSQIAEWLGTRPDPRGRRDLLIGQIETLRAVSPQLSDLSPALLRERLRPIAHQTEALAALLVNLAELAPARSGGTVALELNWRTLLLIGSASCLLVCIGFALHQRLYLQHELRVLKDAEVAWHQATLEVFDSLPVPVVVIGDDRSVRYANEAARAMSTGAQSGEDVTELARRVWRSVDSQAPNASGTFDFPLFDNDGSVRHVTVAVSPFRLLGETAKTYVIADNTLLRDAELRAMTAGKLAVLGELSSAVAHELNQPLAVIKAAAANGRNQADKLPGAARIADKFSRIDEQIERARRIIENVRRLGRPAQAAGAVFSVARTLRSTFGLVSQQFKLANISLETDVDVDDSLLVSGEGTLFEIAILNILLNARDALESRSDKNSAAVVRVRASTASDRVKILLADNAGGIPAQLLPRIFESFVSSKSADAGTGLGLSIARRAVEGMGGSILAQNADCGAVFSIDLPISQQEIPSCKDPD